MSRVLLGHSYFLRFDSKLWESMQPYPPLGTLYAAAMLRGQGHEVHLFDAMLAEGTAEWTAMLERVKPDVAVLFEDNFNYLSKMCLLNMRDAAFEMLAAARERGYATVAAGADVTDHAAAYLAHGAGFAIIGEGEETLCELIAALAAGGDTSGISGLTWAGEGEPRSSGRRANMHDLGSIPMPARDLVDLERYRRAWDRHGRFAANIVTSRGCPFHCNWCAKPIWGQRYTVRAPASVATEVEALATLGVDYLWFMDDILGLKPGWLPEFADALDARGVRLPFKCLGRADLLLRPGEVEALKRAGCDMVWIGAESGSQKVLDAMEKGTTVAQIREAAAALRDAGIGVAFFLQFGYPGETWEDIQATLRLVRECNPDDIGMSVSYPLPGTPFFDRVQDQMGRTNWVDSGDMAMLYDGPYPTSFYRRLHSALHAEFRLRKAFSGGRPGIEASPVKQVASLIRDAAYLPLARLRLERERRIHPPARRALPVLLTRAEASTPSSQAETPVAAGKRES